MGQPKMTHRLLAYNGFGRKVLVCRATHLVVLLPPSRFLRCYCAEHAMMNSTLAFTTEFATMEYAHAL